MDEFLTCPLWDEVREEGRLAGQVEFLIVDFGKRKFGRSPTKKQQECLRSITHLPDLLAVVERLLLVNSWADLLRRKRQTKSVQRSSV